jgi:predicted MFS family arabinose efflux permease
VRRITQTRISLVGLTANVLIMVGVALTTNLPLALALLLASQYTQSLVIINGITLRQQLTPDRLQGRVNVTARMIAWGGQPFGAAIGGFVADRLSISTTYLLLTAGLATSALLAWCSPLRSASKVMIERLVREAEPPAEGLAVPNPP